jgi:dTDP-4-amino-4,6-dideoxygalactose transaminase
MIRVLVPELPDPGLIQPYLQRMDESRDYVNDCALVREFEQALRRFTHTPVAAVSNGTVAIELALRSLGLPPRSRILVPSVTYVATGQAVRNAGHVPVLADVDPYTWTLDANYAASRLDISAVVPVAAFGRPVDAREWESYRRATGTPVVIDAAGSIFTQDVRMLTCFSLHATKFLGIGEGGVIAAPDVGAVGRVRALANFGPGGTNAKMSGIHAAVGLAAATTDAWMLAKLRKVATLYSHYALRLPASVRRQAGATMCGATLMPVLLPEGFTAVNVAADLQKVGIDCKRWYAPFLHERTEFLDCDRVDSLPVSQHAQPLPARAALPHPHDDRERRVRL